MTLKTPQTEMQSMGLGKDVNETRTAKQMAQLMSGPMHMEVLGVRKSFAAKDCTPPHPPSVLALPVRIMSGRSGGPSSPPALARFLDSACSGGDGVCACVCARAHVCAV